MRTLCARAAAIVLAGTVSACLDDRLPNTPPVSRQCGANLVARWVNADPTPEVRAYIAGRVGDRPIRYYTQGDPVTMDYNPARLNVELGANRRIKRFRCG